MQYSTSTSMFELAGARLGDVTVSTALQTRRLSLGATEEAVVLVILPPFERHAPGERNFSEPRCHTCVFRNLSTFKQTRNVTA